MLIVGLGNRWNVRADIAKIKTAIIRAIIAGTAGCFSMNFIILWAVDLPLKRLVTIIKLLHTEGLNSVI